MSTFQLIAARSLELFASFSVLDPMTIAWGHRSCQHVGMRCKSTSGKHLIQTAPPCSCNSTGAISPVALHHPPLDGPVAQDGQSMPSS